ncbi:MAG: DNA polymerase IV, partial [Chitinophagales bacterium]
MPAIRKIIHIDMDAFYASIEQRDNPTLRGKPVAVGGSAERGVVAAASYEARKYGVHSAMPSVTAKRKCPHLIFVKHRFEVYRSVSIQIREIFRDYTELVEPLSLDEAYLDVTSNKKQMPSATLIAEEIRQRIFETTGLTASAGISFNKFLAKVASDVNKPNGITVIPPEKATAFLEQLPINKFHGIGKVTEGKMRKLGIHNGADLKGFSEIELVRQFGKSGRHYYNIVRGKDEREVEANRIRKSVGAENTFESDLSSETEMLQELEKIAAKVVQRLKKSKTKGRTITLKLKYQDFKQHTRSKSFPHFLEPDEKLIMGIVRELLHQP